MRLVYAAAAVACVVGMVFSESIIQTVCYLAAEVCFLSAGGFIRLQWPVVITSSGEGR